jgi:tetratricopeptide (TPR) repeat protein
MDFRTCPACQASVLEDDAQDCPFCGASMTSGKPGGKPQPAGAKPASAPKSTKPAAVAAPAPKDKPAARPAAKKSNDSGDPFEVDTSAARKAIPVRPKPAKGFMVRIVCPMCEKAGFISEQDAGKEVKCCNPQCLVPVFVAPGPKEPEPEPAKKPDHSGKIWMGGLLAIVLIGGGVAWSVLSNRKNNNTDSGPSQGTPFTAPTDPTDDGKDDPVVPALPVKLTDAELRKQALDGLQAALNVAEGIRDRAFAVRLLAESRIASGQITEAQKALANMPPAAKAAAVQPLVMQAERQRAGGDTAAAATLTKALEAAATLPVEGRETLDATSSLAVELVTSGKLTEATALVLPKADSPLAQSSAVWCGAFASSDIGWDRLAERPSLKSPPHAQWASVTLQLAERGNREGAMQWIAAAPQTHIRDNCAAVLATELAWSAESLEAVTPAIEELATPLTPAGEVAVWAGVGIGRLERGDKAGASTAAARAEEAFAKLAPVGNIEIPPMKELFDLAQQDDKGLPVPDDALSAASAAIDLAELYSRLGKADEALRMTSAALDQSRGIAPSAGATSVPKSDLTERTAATRRELAEALGIAESQVFAKFSEYERQVRAWHDRALLRLDFEANLLGRIARLGHAEAVWTLARERQEESDPAVQQPFLSTTLSGLLRELAVTSQQDSLKTDIESVYGTDPVPVTPGVVVGETIRRLSVPGALNATQVAQLTDFYQRASAEDRQVVDAIVLARLIDLLGKSPTDALAFALSLPDTLVREDALRLLAARGVQMDLGTELVKAFDARARVTNSVAFYRGVIDGLGTRK